MWSRLIGLGEQLAKLTNNIIDNVETKDLLKQAAKALKWCYEEISRLNQLVMSMNGKIVKLDNEVESLKTRLAKYEKVD